jgi:hypothetical protein
VKNKLITKILTAFLTAFLVSSSIYAVFTIGYVDETGSLFSKSGTMWDITNLGYGLHAYQYLQATGGNTSSWGKWKVSSSTPTTRVWWWAWVPTNAGGRDAYVQYRMYGTAASSTNFNVDQELYADTWVYLGYKDSNSSSYLRMANSCVTSTKCQSNYQVWWDQAMYQHG